MIWPAIIIGWTVLLYTKYQYYFAAEHNAAAESQNTSTARCAAKLNRKKTTNRWERDCLGGEKDGTARNRLSGLVNRSLIKDQ